MKKLFTLLFLLPVSSVFAQKLDTLTVEKIMRDPKWIGVSPSAIRWSDDSKKVYFKWNPDQAASDGLYAITPANIKPQKISLGDQRGLTTPGGDWNKNRSQKVFEKNGDLFLENIKNGKIIQLTNTEQQEDAPLFSGNESEVIFKEGSNLFALKLNGGQLVQLTNFVRSSKDKKNRRLLTTSSYGLKNNSLNFLKSLKKKRKKPGRIL